MLEEEWDGKYVEFNESGEIVKEVHYKRGKKL